MLKIALIPTGLTVAFLFLFGVQLWTPVAPLLTVLMALLLILPTILLPAAERLPLGKVRTLVHRVAEAVIVPYLYLLIVLLIDACILILFKICTWRLSLPLLFIPSAVFFLLLNAAAMLHARTIKVRRKTLTLQSDGVSRGHMKVVLFSDLHLGYFTTAPLLARLEEKILAENPDCILFAGDLFDSDYDELRRQKEARAFFEHLSPALGIYSCPGNHDRYTARDPRRAAFLSSARIVELRDERADLPLCALLGRPDKKEPRKSAQELLHLTTRTAIVLDHRPDDARALIDAGASLVLCGHTHNGQTFPGNLLAKIVGRYNFGLKKYKNGYILTSAGCGYWGLPMRLITANEIVALDLNFE